jgi:hypothetical protein
MSGVVMASGIVLLLTALGLAIGITAVGDPRAATAGTAKGLGIGAGFWAGLTLLVAYFLGGLVSTMVTDCPDRGGALIHGAMVWTLASGFLLWLLGQGISLGASGLLGALSGLTRTATTAVSATVAGGGDLAHQLGLTDSTRIMDGLDDPQTVSLFASVTGMPTSEAQTALAQFRTKVEAVRDNPDRVAAEVRGFLTQYKERATAGAEGGSSGTRGGHRRLVCHCCCAGAHAGCGHPGGTSWDSEPAHLAHPVGARRQRVTTGELRGVASTAFVATCRWFGCDEVT